MPPLSGQKRQAGFSAGIPVSYTHLTGAQIRYLTLVGAGLIQLRRYDQAISMFDQALTVAQTIPELGQPVMTYAGKAQALAALGRTSEAKTLLESVLEISHKRAALGYESEALLELAKLEERTGQDTQAVDHFRQAIAAATKEMCIRDSV